LAKKLNPKWAASRAAHAKKRKVLKKAGLCMWRCGRKQAVKPGGGRFVLCRECRKLQKAQNKASYRKRKEAAA
jgi:hypothetical protein